MENTTSTIFLEKEIRSLEVEKALLFDKINDSVTQIVDSTPNIDLIEKFHDFGTLQFRIMIKKRELLQLTQNITSDES